MSSIDGVMVVVEEDEAAASVMVVVVGLLSEEEVVVWILGVLVEAARKAVVGGVRIRRTENRTRRPRKQLPVLLGMAYPSCGCVCMCGYV